MAISFTRVDLPHGWLGNMASYPVKYDGKWWPTTEALFQALRFDDPAIKEELRAIKSPMGCKMKAKKEKDGRRAAIRARPGEHGDGSAAEGRTAPGTEAEAP